MNNGFHYSNHRYSKPLWFVNDHTRGFKHVLFYAWKWFWTTRTVILFRRATATQTTWRTQCVCPPEIHSAKERWSNCSNWLVVWNIFPYTGNHTTALYFSEGYCKYTANRPNRINMNIKFQQTIVTIVYIYRYMCVLKQNYIYIYMFIFTIPGIHVCKWKTYK